MSMPTVSGGPSFCWQCNRQLHRAPGKGLGLFYALTVRDKGDHEHRIHGDCLIEAKADGCKLVLGVKPAVEA